MNDHHDEHIEINGETSRPSDSELQRRSNPDEVSDHELYELINSPDSAADDPVADAVRRLYFGMLDQMRSALTELRLQVSNVRNVPDAVRTIDTLALALGFPTVCSARNSAELARKWGKPKETINKPLLDLIEKLKLPKLAGQRSEEAVMKMENARREKIKQKQHEQKR